LIALITHGDLDGLTAGAIAMNVLLKRDRVLALIAQPYILHKVLEKVSSYRIRELYVIDISVDPGTWSRSSYFLSSIGKSANIYWIDHHRTSVENIFSLLKLNIKPIVSLEYCSSRIVAKLFLNETDDVNFFQKLAVIGEVGDKVKKVRSESRIAKLVEEVGSAIAAMPSDNDFKIKVMRMWATKKILLNDEMHERAKLAREKLDSFLKKANERKMFEDEKCLVIDFRELNVKGYVGKIASEIAETTGKLVLIIFNPNKSETVFTFRVPLTVNYDVTHIVNTISRKYGGSGGGHKRAASFRVPQMLAESALKEVMNCLMEV